MNICICDDEKNLRHALKKVIETEMQLQGIPCTIQEYGSGNALLQGLQTEETDILFLDIEMEGLNGMETARELRKINGNIVIIFVTAYPDYVFQGYEVHAFHYILKPYREEKIREVLRMALEETRKLEEQYYVIEQKSGIRRLPLKEIYYFKSDRKKVCAVTSRGTQEFYGSLSDVETEVPDWFIRIHNRYLVNLNHISGISTAACSCGGEELPVSRACRQELAVAFAQMMLRSS
ncbi:MAG TPA: LytTR family DNA-binding domain-containing protein [Candidatus Blautia gallistercoris]|uniref:Stage 0 sporulation protein A homolog n=1 Tax=Candidatus Blautia gallistercoris TaxID=2838490 RepID=A0A9D1WH03_9FIRM|nr:LytTR family DNA-binding domain-containing protein [Candidatus Blautia gallistercoris]